MGRRSPGTEAQESLELFLDTASNAFGGVVFIALLVIVMLQLSGASAPEAAPRPQLTPQDIAKLEAEADRLRGVLAAVRPTPVPPEQQGRNDLYLKLKAEKEDLEKRLARTRDIAELQGKIGLAEKEIADAKGVLVRIEDQIKQARQSAVELPVDVSHAVPTDTSAIALFVAEGRMRLAQTLTAGGDPQQINDAEIHELREGGKPYYTFRPNTGTPIADDDEFGRRLTQAIGRVSPQRYHLTVVVWPDSYQECEWLLKRLRSTKFRYQLVLMRGNDEAIGTGPRTGKVKVMGGTREEK